MLTDIALVLTRLELFLDYPLARSLDTRETFVTTVEESITFLVALLRTGRKADAFHAL